MQPSLTEKLESWVAAGGCQIGQLAIAEAGGDRRYRVTHLDDRGCDGLVTYTAPADARLVVRYDVGGHYRALKSAPDLGRGWELVLDGAAALREALDYLYPAVLGTWFANDVSALPAVPLRDVLGRQTGMYRFANQLSAEGAQKLVGQHCAAAGGCLKRVCWELAAGEAIRSLPAQELSREPRRDGEMPMLCLEACNWLVAKAREASAAEFAAREQADAQA